MLEKIMIRKYSFCEHCGILEPFSAMFEDNETSWCLGCAMTNGDITIDEFKEAEKLETQAKIKYLKERIKELKIKLI